MVVPQSKLSWTTSCQTTSHTAAAIQVGTLSQDYEHWRCEVYGRGYVTQEESDQHVAFRVILVRTIRNSLPGSAMGRRSSSNQNANMKRKNSTRRSLNTMSTDAQETVDFETFQKAFKATCESTPIKATRRIFFNHLNKSIEERGIFHVDLMYGSGSGILIKHDYTFYLLTADHVISNATSYSFTNESPFWVPSQANRFPQELEAFLMPAQILHIGKTLTDRGHGIDPQDLILIELFFPSVKYMPDKFIDLDANPEILAATEGFYQGQFLVAAGYPFETNHFEFFEETPDGMTHSTYVNRLIVDGICEFDEGDPIMGRLLKSGTFPNLSGASGGIVTNIPTPDQEVKMLGMLVSAGSQIVRFIPSYVIAEALSNKAIAQITAVDPAFEGPPPLEMRKIFLDLSGYDIGDDFVNPGAV